MQLCPALQVPREGTYSICSTMGKCVKKNTPPDVFLFPVQEMLRYHDDTVDGRNLKQPPGMYKTLQIMGYLLYQLVQDFFHQQ